MQTGKIHLGLPPITAVASFSGILSAFRSKYPQIHIQLYEFEPKRMEEAVQYCLQESIVDTVPWYSEGKLLPAVETI